MELPNGEAHTHSFDKDHNYSMSLQGVVDSNMRFLDVMCGMPGVCNDIRVLRNSSLYFKAQSRGILNRPGVPLGHDQQIREYIIGDGGYMNLPWFVIPYPVADSDPRLQTFN
ncbi:hypothetical protein L7F22_062060 [Adiantum nelumboides]|nr:hypothetical protein [Adiantum nelumboides]